jgi:hypothetical protein
MIGVLLAHNLEHVHGSFSSMWNRDTKPGMINLPPKFGERFGVALNRLSFFHMVGTHALIMQLTRVQVPDMGTKHHIGPICRHVCVSRYVYTDARICRRF